MRTHNICLYKKVNKKYTGCNLKTMEFHECALIGVCAVIRSSTIYLTSEIKLDIHLLNVVVRFFFFYSVLQILICRSTDISIKVFRVSGSLLDFEIRRINCIV